jgi:hypothetical protein
MHLSNDREIIIVGGTSELVIYAWDIHNRDEPELLEYFKESLTNITEIAIVDNWFVVKYKKKKAMLFRIVADANEFEIRSKFKLKMNPYKSCFRTMEILRLRRQQLLIVDSSFESNGTNLQMEIFCIKDKRSLSLEDVDLKDEAEVTVITYSPECRKMFVFDKKKNLKIFKFEKEFKDSTKSEIKTLESRKMNIEGFVTRVVLNRTKKIYLLGTSKGEILFYESDDMKLMTRFQKSFTGMNQINDIMITEYVRDTIIYAIEKKSKDMKKFIVEPILGNKLIEKHELTNPIYYRGSQPIK